MNDSLAVWEAPLKLRSGFAAALLIALLAGCGPAGDGDAAATGDSTAVESAATDSAAVDADSKKRAIAVDVVVLRHGSIESVLRASANLEAESRVAVLAEAQRRVTELFVEEGDVVRKGQQLLRLEDAAQRTELKRAQTEYERTQRELRRQESLHGRNLAAEQALNDAQDAVARAELALEDAQRQLSYTQVRAPISGTVTARMVTIGNQVNLGEHLFDIVDFESIVAYVFMPEKNLKQLAVGQPVRVVATAVRSEAYASTVERISPVVDPRSGTVKVTVGVGGKEGLRPGLFVDVAIVTATHEHALLIPKRALVYDNDQIFVYRLLPERRVERVLVLPALADENHVVPVSSFAAGDTVIVAGQTGLKAGARVKLPGDTDAAKDEPAGDGDARTSAASDESATP